mgnify:CR=1 FL=1
MKIVWITPTRFGKDLCQTTQVEAARAMKKRGMEVIFVAPKNDSAEEFLSENMLEHRLIGCSNRIGWRSLSFSRKLRKELGPIIDEVGAEVAIVEWHTVIGSSRALVEKSIPWIIEDRSPPVSSGLIGRAQWFLYDQSWKIGARQANGAGVISNELDIFTKKRFGHDW